MPSPPMSPRHSTSSQTGGSGRWRSFTRRALLPYCLYHLRYLASSFIHFLSSSKWVLESAFAGDSSGFRSWPEARLGKTTEQIRRDKTTSHCLETTANLQ